MGTGIGITGGHPALVLAPHPDDEVLGCGGLIAAASMHGAPPLVVVLTDGTGSHPRSASYKGERLRALREAETRKACRVLGLPGDRIRFLRYADTAAPMAGAGFRRAVRRICALSRRHRCRAILAPWSFDPHCDHLAAHMIAAEVARRTGVSHLSYPVWGWTLPAGRWLDTGQVCGTRLELGLLAHRKALALQAHASQLGRVITDDPGGFHLDTATIAKLTHGFEVFLRNR
jgi:LmbE family N-acetylglucosaminyl deacetylase